MVCWCWCWCWCGLSCARASWRARTMSISTYSITWVTRPDSEWSGSGKGVRGMYLGGRGGGGGVWKNCGRVEIVHGV
jgi:hypothetical protein